MNENPSSASQNAGQDQSIDTSVPHSARIWNYWLGGKDNYPVDRQAGDSYYETFPEIVDFARAARAFLQRAVTYLTREAGIRQFLDVGTGMPTHHNTHEVAQSVAPECRIVYVDNDPLVLAHARALLIGSEQGATDYLHADLRDPDTVLKNARQTLDLTQPVGLMLMGVLGHIPDDEAPGIVGRLLEGLPSGSYLVHYDATNTDEDFVQAQERYNEAATLPYNLRSPEHLRTFFAGLEFVEPGHVQCSQWRPDPVDVGTARESNSRAGVARKP
ncbi:S-adenosyl methyltransferase [Haloactinospora alba]|uniref:S-adenosyl methyltransferase n=1 Tax=Haloactinospora alba TaxID=405555 RepID=A0A543NP66_9ACTN|nr:SAM-dependent methyltransferase [Haloactinospora alba]TQN33566.1 S-adenosyl methyltransferase [Haloactinospora alba]